MDDQKSKKKKVKDIHAFFYLKSFYHCVDFVSQKMLYLPYFDFEPIKCPLIYFFLLLIINSAKISKWSREN